MCKQDSNSSQPYIYYSAMYFVICFSVSLNLNIFSIYKEISHKTPGKSKHWDGNDLKCRLPVRHYTLTGLCLDEFFIIFISVPVKLYSQSPHHLPCQLRILFVYLVLLTYMITLSGYVVLYSWQLRAYFLNQLCYFPVCRSDICRPTVKLCEQCWAAFT